MTVLSDTELLQSAREGNQTALTELYIRHRGAARRVALACRNAGDPDDLVNDAFEKVFGAIRRESGPTEAFRAYLFVTIRRLAARYAAHNHDAPYDEVPEPVVAAASAAPLDATERQIVTRAFGSLPERWQAVLWHTAVEGRNPREVAAALGMKANAVSALAYRAREKLRQAYLQAHLQAAPRPECEPHRSALGAYVRDGLGKREQATTARHVGRCTACQSLVHELSDVNQLLARSVMPMFLATGLGEVAFEGAAGAATSGLAAEGVTSLSESQLADLVDLADVADVADVVPRPGRFASLLPDSFSTSQVAGGVATSVVLLVALGTGGSMLLDRDDPGPSTETADADSGESREDSSAPAPGDARTGRVSGNEHPGGLQTLDLANGASCFPGGDNPVEGSGSAGSVPETSGPTTTAEADGASDQAGLLGLQLDLQLPVDLAPDLVSPVIQQVDCDNSSGENELVVTIGDGGDEAAPEPEEEPEEVASVETGDVTVDALPGVVPEVEANVDVSVDQELGARAVVETNLNELCEHNEERGDLICTVDSALGGVVTGTLSDTGTSLELDGPGGQVVALELLTDGNIVADTKLLNLLP